MHESISINKRLKLAQLQPSQAAQLFTLTDTNRGYLGEFLPWVSHVQTANDSLDYINETLKNRKAATHYSYGIELDGEIVGSIGIRNLDSKPEIGYWIAPTYSGKGITSQCVKALTEFGFRTLGLKEIIIKANPKNIASNKIAEKNGYKLITDTIEDNEELNIWSTSVQ